MYVRRPWVFSCAVVKGNRAAILGLTYCWLLLLLFLLLYYFLLFLLLFLFLLYYLFLRTRGQH
ncbi:hypothetical protein ES705_45813 [subsurface metagenome]